MRGGISHLMLKLLIYKKKQFVTASNKFLFVNKSNQTIFDLSDFFNIPIYFWQCTIKHILISKVIYRKYAAAYMGSPKRSCMMKNNVNIFSFFA